MPALAAGLDFVDLRFRDRPQLIATAVLHATAGIALIDPGPTTTLATLEAELGRKGIRLGDIGQILLTHIHLDHAGATGTILQRHQHIDVLVHGRGAPHLIDPSKLIASAGRLYGQDMDLLWGDVRPVPSERIRTLEGGETLTAGGRELRVAYTPGHASHHISFFDVASRVAFVGDTAGIRRGSGTYILPPAPPPDVDLEAWRDSGKRILAWDPETLFLTHFGPYTGAARQHFSALFEHLTEWSSIVRRLLGRAELNDDQRQRAFVDETFLDLRRRVGEVEAEDYIRAGGLNFSWMGLSRYWRKRQA
jgi:glyoxylase-like metal-dependent hydrolase (beta-lactamase superfamily II)